jgi:uncharacterized protein (DUF1684 family)
MDELELLDWRRRVFELYDAVREEASIERATATWRAGRDALFATHAQSPLPAARRSNFAGLPYFPFDAEARVIAAVVPAEHRRLELGASTGAPMSFVRFALARALPARWRGVRARALLARCVRRRVVRPGRRRDER